ncbi:hypothetical protein [Paenibacillus sp. TC-CSREp1]|uniref:hypothetical protein n=1 Tax=Paenibacillus sp. TC-CSREp1 TaxID=3410089 RepID=UPI003CFA6299
MLDIRTDSDGFKVAELAAVAGGRVVISDYGVEYGTDIGSVSVVNSHGLGGNEWIRNVDDIERHVKDIEGTRWLSAEEKRVCILFLRSIAE